MKLARCLPGTVAGLLIVVQANAADLPTRKAAPVEYVRVCDAYGTGFFFIPGTDTCLRVGGLALAQMGIQPSSQLYAIAPPLGATVGAIPAALTGGIPTFGAFPSTAGYRSVNGREINGFTAVARVELDARTQSPYGTVRTFVRVATVFGSNANYATGSLATGVGFNGFNVTAGPTVSRELAYLDKAFIQFAGITSGRVQSFFDFYADAINYEPLRGSNQTVWAGAYTFTSGGGFSVTAAIEDTASHRGNVASVIGGAGAIPFVAGVGPAGVGAAGGVAAFVGAARMPDVVLAIRYDQTWGAAQLSGAFHQVRSNLFPAAASTAGITGAPTAYALSVNRSESIGFAVQGGLQINADWLSPGDKFWLQATYARGAIGYVSGYNLSFTGGLNATANYGNGALRLPNAIGWTLQGDFDCIWTYSGKCENSNAFAVVGALKHFWTSAISSGFYGSYYHVTYSGNATSPVSPFVSLGSAGSVTTGATNYRELKVGTNLVWTPVKNFDIGAEFAYLLGVTSRPTGLAPDVALQAFGLPVFRSNTSQYSGKLRIVRAF